MTTQSYFDTALFAFLEALHSNNNREWFQAHKQRYGREVRDPMLRFIADFGPRLWQISPRFVADARPNGRSLFRIHRDVRFAQDKRPLQDERWGTFSPRSWPRCPCPWLLPAPRAWDGVCRQRCVAS